VRELNIVHDQPAQRAERAYTRWQTLQLAALDDQLGKGWHPLQKRGHSILHGSIGRALQDVEMGDGSKGLVCWQLSSVQAASADNKKGDAGSRQQEPLQAERRRGQD
jgi:hypothetical protein